MCNILIILSLLFYLLYFYRNARKKTENSIYPTMVSIVAGKSVGNGSIYQINKEELILVTTKHLLEEEETVTVKFTNFETAQGKVIAVSKEHDVGFVEVKRSLLTKETQKSIHAISCDSKHYGKLKQDDVMRYGVFTKEGILEIKEGKIGNPNWYVEEFSEYCLYNYCEATPGMSGCGSFLKDGTYIGMLLGGYDNESACLPITTIEETYHQLCDMD